MNWGAIHSVDITTWLFWGRFLTVLLSTTTILITFMIGARLFNELVGLFASVFIAYSYMHITNSYMITVDNPMTFWSLLCICFAAYLFNNPSFRYYLLSAACMGLAVSTKYTAYLCALPIFFAHLNANAFKRKKIINKKLLFAGLVALCIFFITTPYSLIDFESFTTDLQFEVNHYRTGHSGHDDESVSYFFYFSALIEQFGVIQLLLTGIGIYLMLRKDMRRAIFLLVFPVAFFLFIGSYKVRFDRNVVVLIPFLSLFAGYAIWGIINILQNSKTSASKLFRTMAFLLFGVTVISAVYIQAKKSIDQIFIITLPNTRYISGECIKKNIPKGVKIAREFYTPPIDKKDYQEDMLGVCGLIKYDLTPFDYFIASSQDFNRFTENRKKYPEQAARYDAIFKENELIKIFKPENKTKSGPEIRIYKKTKRAMPKSIHLMN